MGVGVATFEWEFMPFVLKYCFNKAQIMEGFNQSKIIDPRTKHWYLSIKADAGIDSVKVAKIEESLGACYRALVEFPGVGRFPPDSLPIDVFRTVHSLYCRAMRTLREMQECCEVDPADVRFAKKRIAPNDILAT